MNEWDQFVESHSGGTPFHYSCWLRTIFYTYSFEPLLYVKKNDSNEITGVIPFFRIKNIIRGNRLISLPFSDFSSPLFSDDKEQIEMIEYILETIVKKPKYIEIRGPLSEKAGFYRYNYYKHHYLKLSSDPEEVRKNINKRTIQYSIRKAKKEGVEIIEENSYKGIEEFYKLYIITRKKHGVPPQPEEFFINLFHNMIQRGYVFILLAKYNAKTIAGGLFIKHKKTIYYKYNVSDPTYISKKAPNHLLTWKAIEKACLNGYCCFDFGRTSPDNQGLIRYKEMWGAESRNMPYSYYPDLRFVFTRDERGFFYQLFTNIWRLMPNTIFSKVGPRIFKYFA